jgi:hypothetical protein
MAPEVTLEMVSQSAEFVSRYWIFALAFLVDNMDPDVTLEMVSQSAELVSRY